MQIGHRKEIRKPDDSNVSPSPVGANQGIVGCVWFIYRKMELSYWLVPGDVKNNRIN